MTSKWGEKLIEQGQLINELLVEIEALKSENKRLSEHIEVLKDAISHLNQVKSDIESGRCPF